MFFPPCDVMWCDVLCYVMLCYRVVRWWSSIEFNLRSFMPSSRKIQKCNILANTISWWLVECIVNSTSRRWCLCIEFSVPILHVGNYQQWSLWIHRWSYFVAHWLGYRKRCGILDTPELMGQVRLTCDSLSLSLSLSLCHCLSVRHLSVCHCRIYPSLASFHHDYDCGSLLIYLFYFILFL